MTKLNTSFSGFIGCDVGKAEIVIHDSRDGTTTTIANRAKPLAAYAATLNTNCLVVCEATGGYESILLNAMLKANIPAHRADARKVKAFIRSFGIRGKTDAIDARALAQYGRERADKLRLWQQIEMAQGQLQSLVLGREDLVRQRVANKNRLAAPGNAAIKPSLKTVIECLTKQIAKIEAQITQLIQTNPKLARNAKILTSIHGIGTVVANGLQALMPELGTMGRREVAALAGVAPHPNQSGGRDKYRKTIPGRPIRSILFMAALSASQSKTGLGDFYRRLLSHGKTKMVAMVAVMRKIIVIANAKLRDAEQIKLS